jgi:ferric-dicitrate binding protein FerR (iron transport regulator)
MSHFTLELAELADLLCEGDIAPKQAARLEAMVAQSDEAKQYLLNCFQVHCELAWEFGRQNADLSQPDPINRVPDPGVPAACAADPASSERQGMQVRGWVFAAMAVALLVAVTLGLSAFFGSGSHQTESHPLNFARMGQVTDVRWCDVTAPAIDSSLSAGSKLAIQQGQVEVVFDSGAKMVLQGPAEVELQSPSSAVLRSGILTAEVPAEARGFAVHTPNCTVVDQGTRFEVDCQAGQTYVEVFVGRVLLQLDNTQSGGSPQEWPLTAGSAVRVHGVPGHGALRIERLAAGSRHFSSP